MEVVFGLPWGRMFTSMVPEIRVTDEPPAASAEG